MKSLATTFLIFATCIVVAGTISLIDRAEVTLSASTTDPSAGSQDNAGDAATLAEFARAAQEKFMLEQPGAPIAFDDLRPGDPDYTAAQAIYPFLHRQLLCPECALNATFSAKNPLSRAQAAVVLVSILEEQERITLLSPDQSDNVLNHVADADSVSVFAQPYIATALAHGILAVDATNRLNPAQPYSRSEMDAVFDTIQQRFPPSATTASLRTAHEAGR